MEIKDPHKKCTKCNTWKSLNDFYIDRARKGYGRNCKVCDLARKKTPEALRLKRLYDIKSIYGLTAEQYQNLLEQQDHKCAICAGKDANKNLAVDHCHDTNQVRGLLCSNCNRGIGLLKDSIQILNKAITYLQEHTPMSNVHDFQASLAKGKAGEELLMTLWPGLIRLDGRKSDFITAEGETLELKTDSYDMDATQNMFIELLSDVEKGSPGGPAQAATHGSSLWVYMYPKNGTIFIFNTVDILQRVNTLVETGLYRTVDIPNKGWITRGVLIPREVLKDLAIVKKVEKSA